MGKIGLINLIDNDDPRLQVVQQVALQCIAALNARNVSRAQKAYDHTAMREASAIKTVAQSQDLDLLLQVEWNYQNRDLAYYARLPKEKNSVEQGLKDFASGMVNYDKLVNEPDRYRRDAAGYVDRDRDKKTGAPRDGMRRALSSQVTRLQNRMALTVTEEEKGVLASRIGLVNAIINEYARLQMGALGETDPESGVPGEAESP